MPASPPTTSDSPAGRPHRSLLGPRASARLGRWPCPRPTPSPALLAAAVERDAGATWLRTDEGTLTFGGAADQVVRLADRLRDAGVGHGDLVVVTARTTPPYVVCWLALAYLGAVTVPTDPGATLDELTGLVHQVVPRTIVTDATLRPQVVEARGQLAIEVLDIDALLGDWTSETGRRRVPVGGGRRAGRPGRPHPHLGHDRQVQARHADAPRLRDGRGRLPVLDGADGRGPADDLAAAVPHQRTRVLRARLDRGGCGPGPAAPLLGQWLPRLGPPPRRDRVQRDRGDAGDPDATAGPTRRRRDRPEALLHRPLPGS